jgi:hypothetical protein
MASRIRSCNSWLGIRGSGKYLRIPATLHYTLSWATIPECPCWKQSRYLEVEWQSERKEGGEFCVQDKCKPEIFTLFFFCTVQYYTCVSFFNPFALTPPPPAKPASSFKKRADWPCKVGTLLRLGIVLKGQACVAREKWHIIKVTVSR